MGRYTLTGTVIFVRGDDQKYDVIGRYKVSKKATLIVSAPTVFFENTETLGGLTEYVEGRRANIYVYANGEIEILLTNREYLPHKSMDYAIELVTDVSKRLETTRDTMAYVFGKKVILSIYPSGKGYGISLYRNKDGYAFLKPLIEKVREKRAIDI
jgi:hypothetical protein